MRKHVIEKLIYRYPAPCSLLPIIICSLLIVTFICSCSLGGDLENLWKEPKGLPALDGTVSISGIAQVGQTLTADTSALGGSGNISYQWMRGTVAIEGANRSTYVLQHADAGATITLTVSRSGNTGSISSEPTNPVTNLGGTVSIDGIPVIGETLTANTSNLNGSGTFSFQWLRGGNTPIGTSSNTYTIQAADLGSTITVTIERSGNTGSLTSAPLGPVHERETIKIYFSQLSDLAPVITGPKLHLIGSSSDTEKTITVSNPTQYESINWYYKGILLTAPAVSGDAGESLILSSAVYDKVGTFFITVEVSKDSKLYSKAISFTVEL